MCSTSGIYTTKKRTILFISVSNAFLKKKKKKNNLKSLEWGFCQPHRSKPSHTSSTVWWQLGQLMNVELWRHRCRGSGAGQPSQAGSVPALTLWMSLSTCWTLGWCRCRRSSSSESSWSILVATMPWALRVHWSNHFSKCSKKPARSLRKRTARVTPDNNHYGKEVFLFQRIKVSPHPLCSFFLVLFSTTMYFFGLSGQSFINHTPAGGHRVVSNRSFLQRRLQWITLCICLVWKHFYRINSVNWDCHLYFYVNLISVRRFP